MTMTFKKSRQDVFVVRGSGTAATDNTAIAAAVSAANALNRPSTILFDGSRSSNEVYVTGSHTLTKAVSLRCVPGTYVVKHASGAFIWGSTIVPWSITNGTIDPVAKLGWEISNPSISLAVGDWVACWAENVLTDTTPHSGSNPSWPMEMHQIKRQVIVAGGAGTTKWLLGDYFDDPLTTSPKIAKLTTIKGIRLESFRMSLLPGAYNGVDPGAALVFNGCVDLELSDCEFGPLHPGPMYFDFCANVRRFGCTFGDTELFNVQSEYLSYNLVDNTCNEIKTQHCAFGSNRHSVTGGASTNGTARVGGAKRRLFTDNTFGGNMRQIPSTAYYQAMPLLDWHSEGRRDIVQNNVFTVPDFPVAQAGAGACIQARCRDVVVKNNTFNLGSLIYPAYVLGTNQTWEGNTFNGGLNVIQDNYSGLQPNVDNLKWINNTHRDSYSTCLTIKTGRNHEISGNKFFNCASNAIGSPFTPKAFIYIASLTDANAKVRIKNNMMDKGSNDYAVYATGLAQTQLEYEGNSVNGYANQSIGLSRSKITNDPNGNSGSVDAIAAVEEKYHITNGRSPLWYVTHANHGLTTSDIWKPINSAYDVYDDTLDQEVVGILADVITEHVIALYPKHRTFEMPVSMLSGSYNGGSSPHELYWDATLSGGKYATGRPGDSHFNAVQAISVGYHSATVMQCMAKPVTENPKYTRLLWLLVNDADVISSYPSARPFDAIGNIDQVTSTGNLLKVTSAASGFRFTGWFSSTPPGTHNGYTVVFELWRRLLGSSDAFTRESQSELASLAFETADEAYAKQCAISRIISLDPAYEYKFHVDKTGASTPSISITWAVYVERILTW